LIALGRITGAFTNAINRSTTKPVTSLFSGRDPTTGIVHIGFGSLFIHNITMVRQQIEQSQRLFCAQTAINTTGNSHLMAV
jgi:hypothetical protein